MKRRFESVVVFFFFFTRRCSCRVLADLQFNLSVLQEALIKPLLRNDIKLNPNYLFNYTHAWESWIFTAKAFLKIQPRYHLIKTSQRFENVRMWFTFIESIIIHVSVHIEIFPSNKRQLSLRMLIGSIIRIITVQRMRMGELKMLQNKKKALSKSSSCTNVKH